MLAVVVHMLVTALCAQFRNRIIDVPAADVIEGECPSFFDDAGRVELRTSRSLKVPNMGSALQFGG